MVDLVAVQVLDALDAGQSLELFDRADTDDLYEVSARAIRRVWYLERTSS